jgi:hypothetical protein
VPLNFLLIGPVAPALKCERQAEKHEQDDRRAEHEDAEQSVMPSGIPFTGKNGRSGDAGPERPGDRDVQACADLNVDDAMSTWLTNSC